MRKYRKITDPISVGDPDPHVFGFPDLDPLFRGTDLDLSLFSQRY